jgi:cyclophilin family peptidyl-prolyl cis-trans isomerase
MVVELFEDQAPNAVASFIFLVERNFYRNQQFYDVSESLAFTGSPTNEPSGNAGYGIRSEFDRPDRRPHWRGYLTLLVNPDTQVGSSQFAIMMKPRPDLDTAENTVFGRIIEGEEVLDLLEKAGKTWQDMITAADSQIGPPDQILSARVIRKRDHEYVPTRVGE